MSKDFLKDVKEGDILVRALTGGGFTTESLLKVEAVEDNGIFIEGADGDYDDGSVYRFSKTTGKSVNNFVSGFRSELIRVATEEDLANPDLE